ncbi:MAG: NPCBM/NEW2 domain-containing protein, partial [Armatimonadota bacterium]
MASVIGVLATVVLSQAVQAVEVLPDETIAAKQWVSAVFGGSQKTDLPDSYLRVIENYDPVQKDARFGRPLKIGDVSYKSGLFCHANSRIEVRLPGPAKSFTAVCGVDNNEQTAGGQGSVVFGVQVSGKDAFHSETVKGGMPGIPVKVDLGGAREFTISASDSGDGISCDQADWADMKVLMADGKTVNISDLPIIQSYSTLLPAEPPFSFTYNGKPSSELLKSWKLDRSSRKIDANRTERTITCTDPETGLVVRCVGIEYGDFPTVEWTVYLKNTGTSDTP